MQSILLEEKEHLQEMEDELSRVSDASTYIESICQIEARLFEKWLETCYLAISPENNFNPPAPPSLPVLFH